MYSVFSHGRMICDEVRTGAYVESLRQVVQAGSVVVDLGAGTGIFGLLACQLGARRVYAIEQNDIIQVARSVAEANGFSDRIEFIQDLSTRVTLPERADVIVFDLRGVLPWFRHHIPSIVDARRRFLRPGGALIPQRDTLWAAPAEAPDLYAQFARAWTEKQYGCDLRFVRPLGLNTFEKTRLRPEQLLSSPQCWATLNYATVEDADFSAQATWVATRAGTGDGFITWFDTELADGIGFSNSPCASQTIYASLFFPWLEPVALNGGDKVSIRFEGQLVGEDYVWNWDTCILDPRQPGSVKVSFQQSTFYGLPLAPAGLRKRAADHTPVLDEEGQIDRLVLSLMDGQHALGEIAHRVAECFPERFGTWENALGRVGEISLKHSR
jgi:protein arginine N-methyltransferase 1